MELKTFVSADVKIETLNPFSQCLIFLTIVPETLPEILFISKEENARASRYISEQHKKAFTYQHHLLRKHLSHWLNISHHDVNLSINPFGKPELQNTPFHFNMSRSGNHLAFYFGPTDGGIDIETIRPSAPFQEIAKLHFHSNEQQFISSDLDFFTLWTRKEAVLKAMGTGLLSRIDDIDTTQNCILKNGYLYEVQSLRTDGQVISYSIDHEHFSIPLCLSI
jgi:4'-phosphopantetheinyl transferase